MGYGFGLAIWKLLLDDLVTYDLAYVFDLVIASDLRVIADGVITESSFRKVE